MKNKQLKCHHEGCKKRGIYITFQSIQQPMCKDHKKQNSFLLKNGLKFDRGNLVEIDKNIQEIDEVSVNLMLNNNNYDVSLHHIDTVNNIQTIEIFQKNKYPLNSLSSYYNQKRTDYFYAYYFKDCHLLFYEKPHLWKDTIFIEKPFELKKWKKNLKLNLSFSLNKNIENFYRECIKKQLDESLNECIKDKRNDLTYHDLTEISNVLEIDNDVMDYKIDDINTEINCVVDTNYTFDLSFNSTFRNENDWNNRVSEMNDNLILGDCNQIQIGDEYNIWSSFELGDLYQVDNNDNNDTIERIFHVKRIDSGWNCINYVCSQSYISKYFIYNYKENIEKQLFNKFGKNYKLSDNVIQTVVLITKKNDILESSFNGKLMLMSCYKWHGKNLGHFNIVLVNDEK